MHSTVMGEEKKDSEKEKGTGARGQKVEKEQETCRKRKSSTHRSIKKKCKVKEEEEVIDLTQSPSLVMFAKDMTKDIERFLSSLPEDNSYRPQIRYDFTLFDMEKKHPELYKKIQQRLSFTDDEISDLTCFISTTFKQHVHGPGVTISGGSNKLQDAVDYVIELFIKMEQC